MKLFLILCRSFLHIHLHISAQTAAHTDGPRMNINAVRQYHGFSKKPRRSAKFYQEREKLLEAYTSSSTSGPQAAEFTKEPAAPPLAGGSLKLTKKFCVRLRTKKHPYPSMEIARPAPQCTNFNLKKGVYSTSRL